MKLTIEHLAKRLPYGVKIKGLKAIWYISSMTQKKVVSLERYRDHHYFRESWFIEDDRYKPILFPIECLTAEITVKGETFVPFKKLSGASPNTPNWDRILLYHDDEVYTTDLNETIIEHCVVEFFLRHHIDFEQLIPAGLAVSVFDLPENPYA